MSEQKKDTKKDFGFGSKPGADKDGNDKKPKFNIAWIYGIIAVLLFADLSGGKLQNWLA